MNYNARLQKLRERIATLHCDAILIDNSVDLYYLTGLRLSAGQLLVHARGACLLVDGRYIESCSKKSPVPVLLAEPGKKTLEALLRGDCSFIKTLAFDSDSTTYHQFQLLQTMLSETQKLVPTEHLVLELRAVKDQEEIAILRKAADLGSKGYDYVVSLLNTGISEREVANKLEIFWMEQGGEGVAFEPIIAFGPNSSMPHYRAGETKLKKGDPVLIDIGVKYQGYHSDMTRVVFFGEPHPEMRKIYDVVREGQQAALDLCLPGTPVGSLDQAARDLITLRGYGDKFMHGLGHGVGLEIHELPVVKGISPYKQVDLKEGMVITIEPGVYLSGIGGVRLEDTIVITADGYENLTKRSLN